MFHLAWLDHCPNTVVESLSVGTPVICSEDGGTSEIVGSYGLVLHEDTKYNYELKDYNSPPYINVSQVSLLPSKTDLGNPPDLSIEKSASNYIRIFEELLKKIP
jgi:glycosyltransferase involved in cell wall biosynthesis